MAAKFFTAVSQAQEIEVTTLVVGEEQVPDHIIVPGPNLHVRELRRGVSGSLEETVIDEAHLGYDLLVMGAGHTADSDGPHLEGPVDRVLQATPCPTLVVRAPKGQSPDASSSPVDGKRLRLARLSTRLKVMSGVARSSLETRIVKLVKIKYD